MKSTKRAKKRARAALVAGAFALAMAGARTARAQMCTFEQLDCTFCGGEVDQVPCCASASCAIVQQNDGNCNQNAQCTIQCSDGSETVCAYSC